VHILPNSDVINWK